MIVFVLAVGSVSCASGPKPSAFMRFCGRGKSVAFASLGLNESNHSRMAVPVGVLAGHAMNLRAALVSVKIRDVLGFQIVYVTGGPSRLRLRSMYKPLAVK